MTAPHRRFNPLTGSWILVSPQRNQRPWQGRVEAPTDRALPRHDPACYLCPGNTRANGRRNPDYAATHVFDNDFPALLPGTGTDPAPDHPLLVSRPESGRCRVVCFSPRHDLTLADMGSPQIRQVVDCWCEEYRQLGTDPAIGYVQIFENKGALMGCSNPHPHGQVWAQASVPDEPARELERMARYRTRHGSTLLGDYLAVELEREERVVAVHGGFVALVPWWAIWPFETLILPRREVASLNDLTASERDDLAVAIGDLTARYDRLFQVSFPYSAGIHQAPTDGRDHRHCTLHLHFYPPLLRSASVRKFMVGYEMLAGPQRDLTPEQAAAMLREAGP